MTTSPMHHCRGGLWSGAAALTLFLACGAAVTAEDAPAPAAPTPTTNAALERVVISRPDGTREVRWVPRASNSPNRAGTAAARLATQPAAGSGVQPRLTGGSPFGGPNVRISSPTFAGSVNAQGGLVSSSERSTAVGTSAPVRPAVYGAAGAMGDPGTFVGPQPVGGPSRPAPSTNPGALTPGGPGTPPSNPDPQDPGAPTPSDPQDPTPQDPDPRPPTGGGRVIVTGTVPNSAPPAPPPPPPPAPPAPEPTPPTDGGGSGSGGGGSGQPGGDSPSSSLPAAQIGAGFQVAGPLSSAMFHLEDTILGARVPAFWSHDPYASIGSNEVLGVRVASNVPIDRVDISANGGSVIRIVERSTHNGESGFWFTLDGSSSSDWIELRAVAFGVNDEPLVLEPLPLELSGAPLASRATPEPRSDLGNGEGTPVVAWATRDSFPITGNTAWVAVAAFDAWSGIQDVTFEFNQSVRINGQMTRSFTVSEPEWMDLFGHGYEAEYWAVPVEATGWTSREVSVSVRTNDGLVFDHLPGSRKLVRVTQPKQIWLDASNGSDSNDGLSSTRAIRTLERAFAVAGDDADIVHVAPGRYDVPERINTNRRDKYLRFVQNGQGAVFVVDNGGETPSTLGGWLSFEGIDFELHAGLRTHLSTHLNFENVNLLFQHNTWPDSRTRGPATNFNAVQHISFIDVVQHRGFRGPSFGSPGGVQSRDAIVSGLHIRDSGTGMQNNVIGMLIERMTATGNAKSEDYACNVHFDFLHSGTAVNSPAVRQIVRYCIALANGVENGCTNYNFWLVSLGGSDLVAYNNVSLNVQSSQMTAQLESNWFNVTFAHNTLLSTDGNLRGLNVSTKSTSNPLISADLAVVNNVTHMITQTREGAPIDNALGRLLIAGNVYTRNPMFYSMTDADKIVDGAAQLGLIGLGRGLVAPTSSSPTVGFGVPTDVRFDFRGKARPAGAPTAGALEP